MTAMPLPPKPAASKSVATAALVLKDGSVFWGRGIGATGTTVGEVCFNTSLTGYQEILTDPSYAGQIITFTFPHIAMSAPTLKMSRQRHRRHGAALSQQTLPSRRITGRRGISMNG